MKLIRLSKTKEWALIGEDAASAKWYTIEESVRKFVESLAPESEVSIKYEQKGQKRHLTYMTAGGTSNGAGPMPPVVTTPRPAVASASGAGKSYSKSPEEQDTIKKQAIMHASSRLMINRAANLPADEVETEIRRWYKLYSELVG